MESQNRKFRENVFRYAAGLFIILLVIPLSYTSGETFIIGFLGLTLVLMTYLRHLLAVIEKTEQQKQNLSEELRRSQAISTVSDLSAGIAHEINNPLGIISQEAQWVSHILKSQSLQDVKETDDMKDSLKEIIGQVDRCKEIVRKLLNLARDMEPVIQCADVNELVLSMCNVVQSQADERNIRLRSNLGSNIPLIYTDPPLLRQVMLNLLVNAVHAVDRDGEITIASRISDQAVHIEVTDSGCGIPKEQLNRIFTPFFTTKAQGKGTGLGLAICRGIIERLGGSISVESEVGRCTSFTINLPINRTIQGDDE
jgi:two-component system NtrC family sensor kinase